MPREKVTRPMLTRRAALGGVATAAVFLAGCAGDSADGGGGGGGGKNSQGAKETDTPTSTDSPTATEPPTDSPTPTPDQYGVQAAASDMESWIMDEGGFQVEAVGGSTGDITMEYVYTDDLTRVDEASYIASAYVILVRDGYDVGDLHVTGYLQTGAKAAHYSISRRDAERYLDGDLTWTQFAMRFWLAREVYATPTPVPRVEILSHELVKPETSWDDYAVKGVVQNISDIALDYVEINVKFYDAEGFVLDTSFDNISELGPGQKYRFEVELYADGEVADYEIWTEYDVY